jgi:hypothetical protein
MARPSRTAAAARSAALVGAATLLGVAALVALGGCGGGGAAEGPADPASECPEGCDGTCDATCSGVCGSCGDGRVCSSAGACVDPAPASMSFFVTSTGNGARGGDFGGIEGADGFCQALADAAGSARTFRAYLSTSGQDARDRIGAGPWTNAAGAVIAADVTALHEAGLFAEHALDEYGQPVPNVSPNNEHDILTGSNADGTASGASCADYTSSSRDDVVTVGHCDAEDPVAPEASWNAAHLSNGCDAEELRGTGSAARLYCFAID